AEWHGRWADTHARAILAWHRSAQTQSAQDSGGASIPQFLSAYVPNQLPEDPVLAEACMLAPTELIDHCAVPFGFFASAGAGLLPDSAGDRPSATADVPHREGIHVLRAGATYEDARLVNTSRFTGNELQRSIFDGQVDREQFYRGDCEDMPGAPCDY